MVTPCFQQQPCYWVHKKCEAALDSFSFESILQIVTKVCLVTTSIFSHVIYLFGQFIQQMSAKSRPLQSHTIIEQPEEMNLQINEQLPMGITQPLEGWIIPTKEEMKREYENLIKELPWKIIKDQPELFSEALKLENKARNRYQNALPFDANRVIFEEGQYCNASWIQKEEHPVIATQGPLNQQVDNSFWPMIWQHASTIVMLTQFIESGRQKCNYYFPDDCGREEAYGEFIVLNTNESDVFLEDPQKPGQIIKRTLSLEKEGLLGKKDITHFHLTGWNDHEVSSAKVLAVLLQEVITHSHENQAVVVHCSAGLGRAGTFITALLSARKILKDPTLAHKNLSEIIAPTARAVRAARAGSIQTEDQYQLVYQIVREFLNLKSQIN